MLIDQLMPRFIGATSYWLTFCAVALAVAGTPDAGGTAVLDADAAQRRQAGHDLGRMILILIGFLALLVHLCTLAVGYRRWRVLRISRWGIGSAVAGALSYAILVPLGGLFQRLAPAGSSALNIAMFAVPALVATVVVFELLMRTRITEHL